MRFDSDICLNDNPIDIVENIFQTRSVSFERRGVKELVAELEGKWDNMLLFFAWEERLRCLHISCLINMPVTFKDKKNIFELLAGINENLWMGHFSYWNEQNMPVFKHSVILQSKETDFEDKLDQIIGIAVNECELAYPLFKAVLTQNMPPQKVLGAGSHVLQ